MSLPMALVTRKRSATCFKQSERRYFLANQMHAKGKTNRRLRKFSRAFPPVARFPALARQLHVFASNSDWFIALFIRTGVTGFV